MIRRITSTQFYHKMTHDVLAKVHDDTNGRDPGWLHTSDETILDWLSYWIVEYQQDMYLI